MILPWNNYTGDLVHLGNGFVVKWFCSRSPLDHSYIHVYRLLANCTAFIGEETTCAGLLGKDVMLGVSRKTSYSCGCWYERYSMWMPETILVDADMEYVRLQELWQKKRTDTLCLRVHLYKATEKLVSPCGSCALLLTTLCKLGSQMKEGSCISVILWGCFLPSKVLQVEKGSGAIMSEEWIAL